MFKKLLLPILLLSLSACAGQQTPLQRLSGDLNMVNDNLLSDAFLADAKATLAEVETWKGKIPDSDYLQAQACPQMIIAGHEEKAAMVAQIQALILSADSEITGVATGAVSPMLIKRLTEAKYAPQGAPGADIEVQIKELETRAIKLVSGVRHACGNLIDDKLLIKMGIKATGFGGLPGMP
jgi:hypothetical protein